MSSLTRTFGNLIIARTLSPDSVLIIFVRWFSESWLGDTSILMERLCPFITLMKSSYFCYFLWIFENVVEGSLSVSFCNFINYVMLLWSFLNSIFELICLFLFLGKYNTAWKESKYGVISGPYFPAFGLNTERYEVSLRIQSECGKIWTRNNYVFGHFSRSLKLLKLNESLDDPSLFLLTRKDTFLLLILVDTEFEVFHKRFFKKFHSVNLMNWVNVLAKL